MAEKDPTINVAKNNLISTRGLATLLGLSPERIRQMKEQILPAEGVDPDLYRVPEEFEELGRRIR